jgi:hypothetical protein
VDQWSLLFATMTTTSLVDTTTTTITTMPIGVAVGVREQAMNNPWQGERGRIFESDYDVVYRSTYSRELSNPAFESSMLAWRSSLSKTMPVSLICLYIERKHWVNDCEAR